jgi:hypothetical protein
VSRPGYPSILSIVGSLSPQAVFGWHRTARVFGFSRDVLLLGLIDRSTQSDAPGLHSHAVVRAVHAGHGRARDASRSALPS